MPKLYEVTIHVKAVVVADNKRDAVDAAYASLSYIDDTTNEARHITTVNEIPNYARGDYLPYGNKNGDERTVVDMLKQKGKGKHMSKPNRVNPTETKK